MALLWVLLLAGCSERQSVAWMEGGGYGWVLLNHRVSYLELGVDDDGAYGAAVGGTSTTGVGTDLPEGCVASECREFPWTDTAELWVDRVSIEARGLALGTGAGTVVAGRDGATVRVEIPLVGKPRGEPVVVLRGLAIDSDAPLTGGPSCYDPAFGWLPRRLDVALGEPVLQGDTIAVDLTVAFEAGFTHEDERACLDAVVEQAQIEVTASVVGLVVRKHDHLAVTHGLVYDYGEGPSEPAPQPPPASGRPLPTDLGGDLAAGYSRLSWAFHEGDDRGAYLRTLSFEADPERGWASGHATNYSPGTQLSGFDYAFEGTVEVIEVRGEVTRERREETVDVELDDDGTPVIWEL